MHKLFDLLMSILFFGQHTYGYRNWRKDRYERRLLNDFLNGK